MASVIRIKRTASTGAPATTTVAGELAYSYADSASVSGGDRLYIGNNSSGGNPIVIGGKYFTDMLDHTRGTLVADSALITDSNSLIASIKTGTTTNNLIFSDGIITADGTVDSDVNIVFTPKNDGVLRIVQQASTTPYEDLIANDDDIPNKKYVDDLIISVNSLTVEDDTNTPTPSPETVGLGVDTLRIVGGVGISSTLSRINDGVAAGQDYIVFTIEGEDATAGTNLTAVKGIASYNSTGFTVTSGWVSLAGTVVQSVSGDSGTATPSSNSFTIAGGTGLTSAGAGSTLTVNADIAIAQNSDVATGVGVASFDSANFEVTANGWVGIKNAGVSNAELVNSTTTIGSSVLTLGSATTDIAGLTSLVVDDLTFNGSTISAVNPAETDITITLTPKGAGTVDVSSKRITSVANPTQSTDAATKAYVDAVKTGLDIKDSVRVATTAPLTVTALGTSVGKTLTNSGTLEALVIDSETLSVNDRVLVKNQGGLVLGLPVGDAADNGIYTVTTVGDISTPWVLTRATDADQNPNIVGSEITAGMFTFVEEGTVNQDSGWVLTTDNPITIDTTPLAFTQFSGAGSVDAGDGLSRSGTTINVGQGDGILVTADFVSVNTSIAGNGLTATTGGTHGGATSINVVGTDDRISVTADAVDIASTYAGQTSIITLGTVTTGTWNASVITVPYGGTGLNTATARGILYGNTTSPLGVTAASTIDGSFLREDATGNPFWSNVIDGGEYGA